MIVCVTLFAGLTGPTELRADGGVVRLRAEDRSMIATVFAPGDPCRDSAVDFTVLVQDRATTDVVLDADVKLEFIPPPGAPNNLGDPWCRPPRSTFLANAAGDSRALPPIRLTRAQADNKLLCGASVIFPVAGDWRLRLIVRRGDESLRQESILPVGEPSSRLAVVWPWLALPPLAIGLFALNQRLRVRRERASSATPSAA